MEILSQEQEQNQVQEPIAEQYAEMERSQDNFYWSQMLKHHLRGKRSLEIPHYFYAMCDWIGERETRAENRRFQWFASIALSSWTQGRLTELIL